MAGLVPAIHVDPRDKPGDDDWGSGTTVSGFYSDWVLRALCASFAPFAVKRFFSLLTASLPHCELPDVQHRLAGEVAVYEAAGDRADFAPRRLDRDLRL